MAFALSVNHDALLTHGHSMNKKHMALILGAFIMASAAISCAPKTPEDRIVDVIETIHKKIGAEKNCDKLAEDLNIYCNKVAPQLSKDIKEVAASWSTDKADASQKRLLDKFEKLKKNDEAACATDLKVMLATVKCTAQLMLMF